MLHFGWSTYVPGATRAASPEVHSSPRAAASVVASEDRSAADEKEVSRFRALIGSGRFWTWFWLVWAVVWTVQIPVAMLTGLKSSIEYLIFISLMALVLACLGAFQSSLTMRKADPEDPL